MIHKQSTFDKWPMQDKSVHAIITSPPYWGLRKYDVSDVIIGKNTHCQHEFGNVIIRKTSSNYNVGFNKRWGNASGNRKQEKSSYGKIEQGCFCGKCNAWRGQYGLEPLYQDYIKHTVLWAQETWRVLKDDGIFFLNLGDTYSGSGGAGGDYNKGGLKEGQPRYKQGNSNLPAKSKILIPHRVAIALIDEGWILRNDIVWTKPNAMPEPCKDRFSKKFEYIFMFVKNKKYYFDINAVREKCKPLNRWGGPKFKGDKKSIWDEGTGHKSYREREVQPNNGMKNPGDVWVIPTKPSKIKHYATWPYALVERMILCSTKEGDTVLDPFCGSGTTILAAEKLGRKGVGIDAGYTEIQKERRLKYELKGRV